MVSTAVRSYLLVDRSMGIRPTVGIRAAIAGILGLLLCVTPSPVRGTQDRAEVTLGEVTIQWFEEQKLGVVVNDFARHGADDEAEIVFILQTADPAATGLPMPLAAAQVVFKEDRLFVVSLEEPRGMALFLEGVGSEQMENSLQELVEARHGFVNPSALVFQSGYGLSRHQGAFSLPLESWPPIQPGSRLAPKSETELAEQGSCISGGPGSSQCDVTCAGGLYGCGVTCREGYYACCNCGFVPSCECVEDDGSGGGYECPPCEPFEDN